MACNKLNAADYDELRPGPGPSQAAWARGVACVSAEDSSLRMCVCVGVALSAVDMFFAGAKTLLTSQRGEALMEIEEEMGKQTELKLSTGMGNNKMLLQLKLSNDSGSKVAGGMEQTDEGGEVAEKAVNG